VITPADAALELLARRAARETFTEYCRYRLPEDMTLAPHHELLTKALDEVEKGECDRLLVMMPPGSAKSTYGSVYFPEYFAGRNPQLSIIAASHTAELAERFGRRVRNGVDDVQFKNLFNVTLAADSTAAGRWGTNQGGEYTAVGVGGSITGRRGDCLLGNTMVMTYNGPVRIDQVKPGQYVLSQYQNRPTYRRVVAVAQRKADEYFRVRTAAGCVVEATGNHRVFVNGVWKETSALVAGDVLMRVLRENGQQGIVRAGKEGQGQRGIRAGVQSQLRDSHEQCQARDASVFDVQPLRSADSEQSAVMLGAVSTCDSGQGWLAAQDGSGAELRCVRQDIQTKDQQPAVEMLLNEVQERSALHDHAAAEQPHMEGWGYAQAGAARAETHLSCGQETGDRKGFGNVRGVQLAERFAVPSHQHGSAGQPAREPGDFVQILPRTTSCDGKESTSLDFVSMVERVRCKQGVDVYDIEVDGAHNFFANDILVHNCIIVDDPVRSREDADSDRVREKTWEWWTNDLLTRLKPGGRIVVIMTRWHEDDLAGRLLEREPQRWKVIKLPMIAGEHDPLGREPGERLWKEWFTDAMVLQAQSDPRSWISLYQQEPRPLEGAEFKRSWISRYNVSPKKMNKIILVDPAGDPSKSGTNKRKKSDRTVMWVVGLASDGNAYLVDGVVDRLGLTQRADKLFALHKKHKPMQVRYERYGMMGDIAHIQHEMEQRQYRFKIHEVAGAVEKNARIRRLIPWFEGGRMWFPQQLKYTDQQEVERDLVQDLIDVEYSTFPVGRYDDGMDALARLDEPSLALPWPDEDDVWEVPTGSEHAWAAIDQISGY